MRSRTFLEIGNGVIIPLPPSPECALECDDLRIIPAPDILSL